MSKKNKKKVIQIRSDSETYGIFSKISEKENRALNDEFRDLVLERWKKIIQKASKPLALFLLALTLSGCAGLMQGWGRSPVYPRTNVEYARQEIGRVQCVQYHNQMPTISDSLVKIFPEAPQGSEKIALFILKQKTYDETIDDMTLILKEKAADMGVNGLADIKVETINEAVAQSLLTISSNGAPDHDYQPMRTRFVVTATAILVH